MKGCLPWDFIQVHFNHFQDVKQIKQQVDISELCSDLHHNIWKYFKHIKALKFNDTPNYNYLRSLLRNILIQDKLYLDFSFDWEKDLTSCRPSTLNQTIYTSLIKPKLLQDS